MRCLTAPARHETRGRASLCPRIPAEGGTRGLEATWTSSRPATRALPQNLRLGTGQPTLEREKQMPRSW